MLHSLAISIAWTVYAWTRKEEQQVWMCFYQKFILVYKELSKLVLWSMRYTIFKNQAIWLVESLDPDRKSVTTNENWHIQSILVMNLSNHVKYYQNRPCGSSDICFSKLRNLIGWDHFGSWKQNLVINFLEVPILITGSAL